MKPSVLPGYEYPVDREYMGVWLTYNSFIYVAMTAKLVAENFI